MHEHTGFPAYSLSFDEVFASCPLPFLLRLSFRTKSSFTALDGCTYFSKKEHFPLTGSGFSINHLGSEVNNISCIKLPKAVLLSAYIFYKLLYFFSSSSLSGETYSSVPMSSTISSAISRFTTGSSASSGSSVHHNIVYVIHRLSLGYITIVLIMILLVYSFITLSFSKLTGMTGVLLIMLSPESSSLISIASSVLCSKQ